MDEGQPIIAKVPEDVELELKETMGKLMISHLKELYQGELDIDVHYEGYTEENHIFNVSIKLEDGAYINFHTLQATADEKDDIKIWPDLRNYGYDTKIRFTLYLKVKK